ncbi:hypothetical protein QVD17_30367 [Tagetes erecta]|uniref:MBD domain-containing protein n=1 Tax=Tagetes erecta TaxID=13708 RepID=A0AAD8NNC8_TARER|nr:hypothetical protein QVD17_30367 [Tagetes erecta]
MPEKYICYILLLLLLSSSPANSTISKSHRSSSQQFPKTMIDTTTNNSGDDVQLKSKSKSIVHLDMKNFSQSELYALSQASYIPENDVMPNIHSDHQSTSSVIPRRVFAFSHRRQPISGPDDDTHAAEDRLILNSLNRLVAESKVQKRKRKSKNVDEFEGLGVIDVSGEAIDLKLLATEADNVFESELNRLTKEMTTEDEFLGFLQGLDGRWGSTRKRRKYVDATVFAKLLPVKWMILLSLRPRVRRPSLYCRRFVSPSNQQFKSCKDVALFLKAQFVTNDNASSPKQDVVMHMETGCQTGRDSGASNVDKEVVVMQMETGCQTGRDSGTSNVDKNEVVMQMETGCQTGRDSGGRVCRSFRPASKFDFPGTNNLNKIKFDVCTDSLKSIDGLASRQQTYGNDMQTLYMDTLKCNLPAPPGFLHIREQNLKQETVVNKDTDPSRNEVKNIFGNGEGSSNEQENSSEGKDNLKTRCVWCLVEFFREPVDAETLESSCGFICPKCKTDVSWRFESALTELTQHLNK